MNHLFLCHRMYIRSRRPFRIILMRHAESEGNVDKGMYSSTPDHALRITERGKCQVWCACGLLRACVGIFVFVVGARMGGGGAGEVT